MCCCGAGSGKQPAGAGNDETNVDFQMDLLRAMEMSRLQFLREMGQLQPGTSATSRCVLARVRACVDRGSLSL